MELSVVSFRGRFFRVLFAGLLAVFSQLLAYPAAAHLTETANGLIYFDRDGASFSMKIGINLEAIMAGIDPKLADTSKSPNAPEYDRLRRLSPDEFMKASAGYIPTLLAGIRFELDGKPFAPELTKLAVQDKPDLTKPRATTLSFAAALPPGAKAFTFGWSQEFGRITIRTTSPRSRNSYVEMLENGVTSSPMVIDDLKSRTAWDMIGDFVLIGFQHIVPKGLDHILFVVGIFLLSTRLRPILAQVTSFTVAHTVTLGLGTLGLINLPSAIVEPLIAASIVYVAVENILFPTLSPWRVAVVFCFGLMHGLGFAGVLRELNIPPGDFVTDLLSFNVGVELGQLAVIAVCFLTVGIWFGSKPWYRQRVVIPGSLAVAAVGSFWFLQRTIFAWV
ncbi:MAG: HupE/UreJ family protein [Paracoccaceae bacterium]